ncbi:unnamed protein product [Sphagnum jensenii]|uniref:Potassium channel domain-containing protein n=1 Tax=Sphagnum jensenii TaxID=128206 RepID=A0ABP1BNJ4_9BRYO
MEEKMGFSPSTTAPRRVAFSEKQSYHRISSADSAPPLFTHYEGVDRSSSSSTIERSRLSTEQEEPDLEKNHELNVVKKKKKYLHRCNTAPAMSAPATAAATAKNADDKNNNSDVVKRPHLSKSGSIVMQAGLGLMVYLAVGVLIYTWKRKEFSGLETVSYVDALYFCIVTMCTIGYGDITPTTTSAKLFACGFVLIGFGFIDALLSGMVNYVLDKQEHLLLSAVEGSHYQVARRYFMNPKHGNRMRIRMKVALAAGVPVLCIIVGTIVMMQMEKLSWIDALYCTIMSITTVGYGDHTFKSFTGRLFAAVWLLFSTLAVARCFLYLTEARVEKRHRAIAKWVLRRQFSVGDLIKADLDHDGCISKAEYVVYKLKEMGNVHDEQIHDICLQFDQLDSNNTGKITLARLQEGN